MNGQELYELHNCPVCGHPFVNEFITKRLDRHFKKCAQINHDICISSDYKNVNYISIVVKNIVATWWYEKNLLSVHSRIHDKSPQFIEWFEPDFSDYKKLIRKLKTYIVFS